MYTVFDREQLSVLLRDFYELTGLRTVVFNAEGADILSYPETLPEFCRLVRSSPAGSAGCRLCDRGACVQARQERRPVIYPCHAGLIEVIAPILVDGAAVGYLLLSHIVQGADEEAEWAQVQQLCAGYGLDPETLRPAYQALPRTPYRTLRAAADLLSMAARDACRAGLARLAPDSPLQRLDNYLAEHLAEDLPCERLCRELNMSRTALYQLARQAYGCGISEQITRLRVARALELLENTDLPNREICQRVGIRDYNYFFRVFRRQTGFTPRDWRARRAGQTLTQPVYPEVGADE